MNKIVYESLFEYQQGVGYTEKLDEGLKDTLAKGIAFLALTTTLSLSPKDVKAMSPSEVQDSLEKVDDISDKVDKKEHNVTITADSKEEAFKKLTKKIEKYLTKNELSYIEKIETRGSWDDAKDNYFLTHYFKASLNEKTAKFTQEKSKQDSTYEDEGDDEGVVEVSSKDQSILKKKINNVRNQLIRKGYEFDIEYSNNRESATIKYWRSSDKK